MFYDFIEFRNTAVKSYYQINIKINENITVVSNDKQMLSNKKESSNNQKKIIDQSSELHDTKTNAITPSAVIFSVTIFSANALNAAASSAFNRAKSKKTFQSSSSIKRGQGRSRKQSIIQLKN